MECLQSSGCTEAIRKLPRDVREFRPEISRPRIDRAMCTLGKHMTLKDWLINVCFLDEYTTKMVADKGVLRRRNTGGREFDDIFETSRFR